MPSLRSSKPEVVSWIQDTCNDFTHCLLVHGALTWLESNQDKSIEDIRALVQNTPASSGTESAAQQAAKSFICNDCGKKLRGMAEVQFHGEKSGHDDFAESTEEIAPLTEEEKASKLAELRERLAAKRSTQSEEDKAIHKRNEEIRRKSTKETQDIKEDLQKKEQIKDAEKKRKEKEDDIRAKEAIRRKIQEDKDSRKAKAEAEKAAREGRIADVPTATPPTPAAPKPAAAYTETRLRLQTPLGNIMKAFPVDTTLFEVAQYVVAEKGLQPTAFTQTFPKKVYDQVEFGATLKELGLVPSASLIVG